MLHILCTASILLNTFEMPQTHHGRYSKESRVDHQTVHNTDNFDTSNDYSTIDIQNNEQRKLLREEDAAVCPSEQVVVCVNGTATSVGGVNVTDTMTCAEACNGQCDKLYRWWNVKTFDLTSIPYNLDAEVFRGA